MRLNLGSNQLRGVINDSKYLYKENFTDYLQICALMDRLDDAVEEINAIDLVQGQNTGNCILWINYADLLLACLEKLRKIYGIPAKDKGMLFKYHKQADKTDYEFFRFIRAIILPHALSMDDKRQKAFTEGKTAYSPFVRWDRGNKLAFKVVYYVSPDPDKMKKLMLLSKNYTIEVQDIFDYIEYEYNTLPDILKIIEQRKKNRKATVRRKTAQIVYDKSWSISGKIEKLWEWSKEFGDIDEQREVGIAFEAMERAKEFVCFIFEDVNKTIVAEYLNYISLGMDDLYDRIKTQDNDRRLALSKIIFPHISPIGNKTDFNCDLYNINHIISDATNSMDIFIKDNPIKYVKKYLAITQTMGREEIIYLSIMAAFKDNMKYDIEYQEIVIDANKLRG